MWKPGLRGQRSNLQKLHPSTLSTRDSQRILETQRSKWLQPGPQTLRETTKNHTSGNWVQSAAR